MAGMVLVRDKNFGGGGFDCDDDAVDANFCPRINGNKINESMKYEICASEVVDYWTIKCL